MEASDIDMIVMHHEFVYGRRNLDAKLSSTLIVTGEDKTYTAMAKTVGLPMAIFTKLFLTGKSKFSRCANSYYERCLQTCFKGIG